ncbi:MAG TPA: flagellar biosynthesis protein FlgN [Spirochaetia bacterium]|nr:flagellar biosynthesis protein FlgN [Spirochaetia bacterium]
MNETSQKIAILKRLREMLQRQREKFQAYLSLLEHEETSIRNGEPEKLLVQAEMEQAIIAEIFTLKKVIEPLETLYQAAYPQTESTVPRLKSTLDAMAQQVIAHNASNRSLLKARMNDLRQEISSLRSWPKTGSPFAEVVPSLIDITT